VATASVATGQTVQLSATPTDANGNPLTGRVITWASSDNTIASVNGSGLVTGVAAGGPVRITATSEGKSGTASITVRTASSGPLPVFPGAMGFGTTTAAGRGGAILRVTNLNDAGAGSLRAALEATGPRTVIFEVGGMIDLSDDIYITSPYLTVAGQTAPSPGITLRYAGLQIQTHDVLVQHLRIRVGDLVTPSSLGQRDGIQIQNQNTPPYNVVIDHVSLSWNTDKNMSTWYALHDVTISHSIIAEPLWDARGQNYNLLIGDYSTNVTVLGNMFAHSDERNPYAKGATGTVVVNNLLYDFSQVGIPADRVDEEYLMKPRRWNIGSIKRPAPAGAGAPVKNPAAQGGGSAASWVLKRASRNSVQTMYRVATPARNWCSDGYSQLGPIRMRINAGARPKLMASHRLSSSAPNLLTVLESRAT